MPKHILMVEDEALVAEIAALTLEDAGYIVELCATAPQAIEQVANLSPHLILLDINLGAGGSGLDVARAMLHQAGPPFVFVTGQADAATQGSAMALGPVGYLNKPYKPSELLAAVEAALAS